MTMIRNYPDEMIGIKTLASVDFLDVFLLGETGTGKTYMARLIHELSPRAGQAFVAVNCAQLSPSIIEAELFGYEKGAFTGAIAAKPGLFEAADGGTLFLDEIGELPTGIQAKLLKVVEDKCITRVGGVRPLQVDVRLIYATNRNLDVLRDDLRYRIAAHTVKLKPLRDRKREIVPLAHLFISEFSRRCEFDFLASTENLQLLEKAKWTGNIRELRSFVEKLCLSALLVEKKQGTAEQAIVITEDLILSGMAKPLIHNDTAALGDFGQFADGDKLESYLRRIETYLLKNALEIHNNNHTRAARELGISRTGLIKKLKKLEH
ncbi:MAG TPA: sigma 54-interacting transcriptional regulator [Pyrinomonadaceae bacterium]|nr:sigma 54-interacting transcriptional regulator [Pyrinomonadaceae bacterium]